MSDEPKKNKKGLKAIFAAAVFAPAMFFAGYFSVGHSDRENAEKTLETMGYTVVEYEGSPWFRGRVKGEIYADEFKAIPPGQTKPIDVIVASGPVVGSTIKIQP